MMDVKYYKERQHNYMVVRSEWRDGERTYHCRMIDIRRMEYILPMQTRTIDGDEYNYYDISAKISLRQLFGSRHIDIDDIRQLIQGIKTVCDEVDRYLLNSSRIVLDPDYIYYNLSNFHYCFMYDVSSFEEMNEQEQIGLLLDYLLEQVKPDDKVATDYVYTAYEYYEKGNFGIWDMIAMLPKEIIAEIEEDEDVVKPLIDDVCMECIDVPLSNENTINTESAEKNNGLLFAALTIGMIDVIACTIVFFLLNLTEDEKMILYASLGVGAALILFSAVMMVLKRNKNDANVYELEVNQSVLEHSYNEDIYTDININDFISNGRSTEQRINKDNELEGSREYNEAEGQTVFFEPNDENIHYKLYALDKKNKQHIDLEKFPCTIGKMTGLVDFCIDHPSVSRLHARVGKGDSGLWLSDLNSTNGVFLNGIRLAPNEIRPIEIGDEIRIGNLNYCLRNCG